MMKTNTVINVLSWLLVAFMLLLAARGFFSAESAAAGFGFPLADAADKFYLHVKADRDLSIGIALAILIVLRQRRALMSVLSACVIIPLIDGILVVASGHESVLFALGVHGSALAFVAILLALLVHEDTNERRAARGDRSLIDRAAQA